MRKKLLIISSRYPYPLEKGDKLRLFYQIKFLSQYFDIYLFALTEVSITQLDQKALKPYVKEKKICYLSQFQKVKNISFAIPLGEAFQYAYFKSDSAKSELIGFIEKVKPDHLHYHLVRSLSYYVEGKIPKTMDLMDAFSFGMRSRGVDKKTILKWIFNRESKKIQSLEIQCNQLFEANFVISKQDVLRLPHVKNTKIASNGVDWEVFSSYKHSLQYEIGFVGNLGYEPNIKAVMYLANVLLPMLKENVNIGIYGARPTKKILDLQSERFVIEGWVEDIRTAYASIGILVAPIYGGMGQQNKVLESMAMGVPCIVSPEVAKGIGAVNGEHLLVCDTPKEYLSSINKMMNDTSSRKRLISNARNFIEDHFGWKQAVIPIVNAI